MLYRTLFAAAALLAAGCVAVRENRIANGSLAVEIHDSGWYVFGFIPILSGDPDSFWPNWFSDDVSGETTMKVLDRIVAREKPKSICSLVTREVDEDVLFVINRVSCHTSAVLIPAKTH